MVYVSGSGSWLLFINTYYNKYLHVHIFSLFFPILYMFFLQYNYFLYIYPYFIRKNCTVFFVVFIFSNTKVEVVHEFIDIFFFYFVCNVFVLFPFQPELASVDWRWRDGRAEGVPQPSRVPQECTLTVHLPLR